MRRNGRRRWPDRHMGASQMTRTPAKGLVLPNGNRLNRGQLFPAKGSTMTDNGQRDAMQRAMQRTPGARANTIEKDSLLHPRNGAPKALTNPAIAHGMPRQTKGELHPYLHGQAINDEVDDKVHVGNGNSPTAFGMVTQPKSNAGDRLRGVHEPQLGNVVLNEAMTLGKGE
jgi:hypothetical protein